ncbi:MAG TPA: FAD-dependent oxidoreductase [Solirubrobacteraceae bacterium]|nr:FAD-dependent oxidoreductase [Solirubrobacteraceae bacterium]
MNVTGTSRRPAGGVRSDGPWPRTAPTAADRAAYADAVARPYWLDRLPARAPGATVTGVLEADLCIIGGGFTGLWAALAAKRREPGRDVVLVEAETVGYGASGRNGGFVSASLTHGLANGEARFADEMEILSRLGDENFQGFCDDIADHGIACDLERTGEITVAVAPHEVPWMAEEAALLRRYGHEVELLDAEAMRAEVASPTYLGGVWDRTGAALVDPGRLAQGLAEAAERLGVRICERSPVTRLADAGSAVDVVVAGGRVRARRVVLGTSAYPPLVRAMRRYIAPVYDYVLVTEPLTPAQLESIGWRGRQGIGDAGNQFHYYRRTADDRILWGGYDAVYRFGGPVDPSHDECDATFARLAQHFFITFPQLEGVRFSHRWGGAIDTCSRFSAFFGTAHGGRVAYAAGYTGLGVCATRFGAQVALDLVDGRPGEATRLRYVRRRPVPFPPEPLRWAVIELTRNRLAAADRRQGRRGIWLGALDRLGLGFDS